MHLFLEEGVYVKYAIQHEFMGILCLITFMIIVWAGGAASGISLEGSTDKYVYISRHRG
jgi:hypothetical protein